MAAEPAAAFGRRSPASPAPAPQPTVVVPAPEPTVAPPPTDPADPTDPDMPTRDLLRTSIDVMSGFSDTSKTKVLSAVDLMERVLSSEQFRQAVLNHMYEGKRQFVQNERTDGNGTVIESNLTNARIYQILMEGAEQLKGVTARIDRVANLNLNLYTAPWYNKWGTVGYGYPGQPEIYMNWYYFNSFTIAEVAANVAHEWTHKLGFDHDYDSTARRPYTVPYSIGDIVQQVAGVISP
jgi:hypothetical protein